jgi:transposase-like protein
MSTEISPPAEGTPLRYPSTAAGIQVNHCKNPKCRNFGVIPKVLAGRKAGGTQPKFVPDIGDYIVVAAGKGIPCLKCLLCSEVIPMQSNIAIAEELLRISAYLEPNLPSCKNSDCANHGNAREDIQSSYVRYGVNAHGTPRYRCQACKKVFAFGGKSTKRQRKTVINRDIFDLMLNSSPIRRVIKRLQISPATFYSRLEFIHRQCLMFIGPREAGLMDMPDLGKRYITTDRQKLMVNWSSRGDRRNTQLLSIASADLQTGYVLGAHLNYDSTIDNFWVMAEADAIGDIAKPRAFRRFARIWLPLDFEEAAKRSASARTKTSGTKLTAAVGVAAAVDAAYEEADEREDVESVVPVNGTRTPAQGVLLHETAVMNAHIQLITRLLVRAPKIRFFVDQESGLRAAIMAALHPKVRNRTADAFFVSVAKEVSIDEKRKIMRRTTRRFKDTRDDHPDLTNDEVKVLMAREEMTRMRTLGKWKDRWLMHPLPDMREPEKMVCWLTDIDELAESEPERSNQLNHFARLYLKASLTAVDRFFMQVRRGLTIAERGIPTSSNERRIWVGKNAYNPEYLAKLLEVFRTYFNYCEVGADGRTPAMRLGLAKGPVRLEDILYYVPKPPARQRARKQTASAAPKKKPLVARAKGASENNAGPAINS